MDGFRQNTIQGVSWSVVGKVVNQLLIFIFGIGLARLLSPREFGLVAMVLIFTGFAKIFRNVGLGAALVQHQDVTEMHRSSVFWVNVGSGIFLTVLFVLLAPVLADFYEEPALVPITVVLAFQFLLGGLTAVHRKLFQKEINFRALALVGVGSTVFAGGTAVIMAWMGYGVWSLVMKSLLNSASAAVILWIASPWRPRFSFSWEALGDLWRFSLNLLGTRSMNFWVRRLDDLLIGRYLGSDPLGIYTKAYKIMLVPLNNVSRVIGRVMFPALSSIQEDIPRVRRIYLRMTETIALITFPLMLGLFATAESFVIGIFGSEWSGMILPLKIFCFAGLWQSIATLNGNLYLSQGQTDLQFRVSLFTKPLMIAGIVSGLYWGLMGVVIGFSAASFLIWGFEFHYAGGLVGLTFVDLLWHLSGVFMCAVSMSVAIYVLGRLLPSQWPHWLSLLTQVPAGAMIYWALVYSLDVRAYRETIDLLVEQWQKRTQTTAAD
ncbi:PST family polysaccharide transporter [Salinibacter ruber]|uniref:MOP flippase family protein n=1 Tax=Salinibacter ruber TaxID=146919 RepID=UPI00216A23C7|nr:PST family polysaccharide transporter [Salinibacter ruber]